MSMSGWLEHSVTSCGMCVKGSWSAFKTQLTGRSGFPGNFSSYQKVIRPTSFFLDTGYACLAFEET